MEAKTIISRLKIRYAEKAIDPSFGFISAIAGSGVIGREAFPV